MKSQKKNYFFYKIVIFQLNKEENDIQSTHVRRGSRVNVDRFTEKRAPKAQAPRGAGNASPGIVFNF